MKNKKIIEYINKIYQLFKHNYISTFDIPHLRRYFLFSLILIFIFFIITFPYEFLLQKKLSDFEGKYYKSIEINAINFSLFGETKTENIDIVLNSGNEILCKNTIISLNPFYIYFKNRIKSDIQLDILRYIFSNGELISNINANINVVFNNKSNMPQSGTIKILLSDIILKLNNLKIPVMGNQLTFKTDPINIQTGNIDCQILQNILKFNTCKLTGNDLSANITGSIEFSPLLDNSKLNLIINIDIESGIFDQYREIINAISKNKLFAFEIKGTIAKPDYHLPSGTSNSEN